MKIRIELCSCLILIFVVVSQSLIEISTDCTDGGFNYNPISVCGPAKWGNYFPQCTSPNQSPINIDTTNVIYGLNYNIWYQTEDQPGGMSGKLYNNGYGLKFDLIPQTTFLFGVPGYEGDQFILGQFHIHYGKKFLSGSEHSVDMQFYPAELHLVHFNSKYTSIEEAIKHPFGVAVVGVFLKINPMPSFGGLDQLIQENVYQLTYPDAQPINTEISLSAILPDNLSFYTYVGSLTTPPCSGNVRWIVLKDTMAISRKSIIGLRSMRNQFGDIIAKFGNFRPTQPLGSRQVEANF